MSERTLAAAVLGACLAGCTPQPVERQLCAPGTTITEQAEAIIDAARVEAERAQADRARRSPYAVASIVDISTRCRQEAFTLAVSRLKVHPSVPEEATLNDLNRLYEEMRVRQEMVAAIEAARDVIRPPSEDIQEATEWDG